MRKIDIATRMAALTELPTSTTEKAIDTILATIKTSLQQGEAVTLRGLGTFAVRAKSARPGRNPKTGEAATIPPRRVVRFKAGEGFKQAVAAVPAPAAIPAPPPPAPPAPAAPGRATRRNAQAMPPPAEAPVPAAVPRRPARQPVPPIPAPPPATGWAKRPAAPVAPAPAEAAAPATATAPRLRSRPAAKRSRQAHG